MIYELSFILAAFLVPVVLNVAINMALTYACYWVAAQIAGKSKLKMPEASNYTLQTSMKGIPKQNIYGTTRTSGNVIHLGPLHPYTVEHDSGGKGGGQSATVEETRYRRSFLLSLGEGPMSVTRIWANDTLIWPYNEEGLGDINFILAYVPVDESYYLNAADVTIFEGIDNSGVRDLTGEDYGEYKHDCLLFFNEYDLGGSKALPNIVAEVSSGNMNYFIAGKPGFGDDIIYKVCSDGTIDTSWATNGKWGYNGAFGSTSYGYDCLQLADGRVLVAHDPFYVDAANLVAGGSQVICTMLTAAGAIDTTWGHDGHYVTQVTGQQYPMSGPFKLLQDNDGNFHIFGNASTYEYQSFDSNGTRRYAIGTYNNYFHDACFNIGKTRIIAVGSGNQAAGGQNYNTIAINPEDGSVDTAFTGNIDVPGYARARKSGGVTEPAYGVCATLDDGFVVQFFPSANDDYSLCKFDSDGAIETSFGTNGFVVAGVTSIFSTGPAIIGNHIVSLGNYRSGGVLNSKIQWLKTWDNFGNLIDTQTFTSAANNNVYHQICIIPGSVVMGTTGVAPAVDNIERYSFGLNYLDSFDPGTLLNYIYALQPIAPARDTLDANPAYIINDLVTNTRYGGRLAASRICEDCLHSAEDYWGSKGMLITVKVNESKPWQDWVDYILAHVGGSRNFDGGKLHIRPFRDEDSQFTLTDDHLVQPNPDDPVPKVQITKRPYSETLNRIELVWTDRENNYDTAVAVAQDEVDQRISGLIRKKTVNLAGIHDKVLAAYMVQRLLIDSMYRFDILRFGLTYENMLIEEGDVGTISDNHTGLSSKKIRVMQKDESEHGRDIEITAIEEYSHLYPDIAYSTQENLREEPDAITFEDSTISFNEDVDDYKLYLSIVPGAADINGWHVYRSYDDDTYDLLGRCGINGVTGGDANSAGTIDGFLPAHPAVTWAQNESVLVDIGTVTDLHTDISDDQFWNDRRLAKIGDEIITFMDAEETATAGIWRISNLRRGLFGTEPVAHYTGESFCTLDKNFTYKFSDSDIGQTLYFKVVAFYGDVVQNIAVVTSQSATIAGYVNRPAAASCLRLASDLMDGGSGEYSGASFSLYWNLGSRTSGIGVGGHDVNPAHPSWFYPDDEDLLVASGGALFGNYIQDPQLQAIVLRFEQEDGTLIGEREIDVAETATITKATDLGGNNPAVIKVIPRRALRAWDENSILVDDGT